MESITIENGLEFLRQISTPIDITKDDVCQYMNILSEFCNSHSCYAMALVQLGIAKRIVYINSTNPTDTSIDEKIILINPKITKQIGKTEFWEACVSGMDNVGLVERPYAITVEYIDPLGKNHITTFEGFSATVVSHELDHLDGIFHMDRAKKIIQLDKPSRIKLRKKEPYKIISKIGDFVYKKIETTN